MEKNKIKKITREIESSNINFLIGAWLSRPFLQVLKNIEKDLIEAENKGDKKKILELKREYFEWVMEGNLKITEDIKDALKDETLKNYKDFYKALNRVLLKRENSLLTKQVNIFTTNIDVFSEKALEELNLDFNDGFNWRFRPIFNLWNFKKSYFKKSLHYEMTSEIPVFNLLKIHWSLTWKNEGEKITLDRDLETIKSIIEVKTDDWKFSDEYEKLMIVNPTEKKFKDTTLNERYYSLLRIYSNELEKQNCILFVMGFSFADRHIRELTTMVAWSNPTLKIYILKYSPEKLPWEVKTEEELKLEEMESEAKNKNIEIIYPEHGKVNSFDALVLNIFDQIGKNIGKENIPDYPVDDKSQTKTAESESIKETLGSSDNLTIDDETPF